MISTKKVFCDNGITIKQLKDFVKDLPEKDEFDEDYEVLMYVGDSLSSPVKSINKLNSGDIIFGANP